MRKEWFSIIGISFVSGLFIGGGHVSAANISEAADPATDKTPITAVLTAPDGKNPNPPGDEQTNIPNGNFGIAYIPTAFSFSGELKSGAMSISDTSGKSTHVGVKDSTFSNKGWDLTASINWVTAIDGATLNMNIGSVKENTNNGVNAFVPSDLITPPSDLTGAFSTPASTVTLNNSPSNILEAKDNFIYRGTYDVELSNISLEIADGSKVVAGTYKGNIDWNLALKP